MKTLRSARIVAAFALALCLPLPPQSATAQEATDREAALREWIQQQMTLEGLAGVEIHWTLNRRSTLDPDETKQRYMVAVGEDNDDEVARLEEHLTLQSEPSTIPFRAQFLDDRAWTAWEAIDPQITFSGGVLESEQWVLFKTGEAGKLTLMVEGSEAPEAGNLSGLRSAIRWGIGDGLGFGLWRLAGREIGEITVTEDTWQATLSGGDQEISIEGRWEGGHPWVSRWVVRRNGEESSRMEVAGVRMVESLARPAATETVLTRSSGIVDELSFSTVQAAEAGAIRAAAAIPEVQPTWEVRDWRSGTEVVTAASESPSGEAASTLSADPAATGGTGTAVVRWVSIGGLIALIVVGVWIFVRVARGQ